MPARVKPLAQNPNVSQAVGAAVKGVALLVLLAVAVPGVAQVEPQPGPALSVLVHHPYPDSADPLGVGAPFAGNGSVDAFVGRYHRYDVGRDGFGYPSMVVDGIVPIEGLPDGDAPYMATRAAYEAALDQRVGEASPVVLEVKSRFDGDRLLAEVVVVPLADVSGDDLHLWVALAEDHVFYEPPPGLGNGVTDHRFTVRAVRDAGPLAALAGAADGPLAPREAGFIFDVKQGWDRSQLFVSAWVQQGAGHGLRFEPLEVVQATTHRAGDEGVTRQEAKGVLLELYSATWCAPCLYGDTVVEELAEQRGHAAYLGREAAGARYWQAPDNLWIAVVACLVGGVALAAPRFGGRA